MGVPPLGRGREWGKRAPFPVVVLAAVTVTGVLRATGVA
ncbi:hypothetical protein QF030_004902 [Streptomyces rishiriensis]|uniref:Uncharacterized protein n=1 Tax=Streptomyces rishiriensis TaxID=68264 RepID=A0ABU0NUC9_STRRH|nr:hypothetical protein [Streptomyces rishiriensis]